MPDGSTSVGTVLFRCDGTAATGLGHTSRSLALAEAFADAGYRAVFLGRFDAHVSSRLLSAGALVETLALPSWSLEEARTVAQAAHRVNANGVVVDSYDVDPEYLAGVQSEAAPLLLIDDFGALAKYPCAAVLNFTSRAHEFPYPTETTRCYLGPRWFLGRRALRAQRAREPRPVGRVRHVLVTSGGNDPFDVVMPLLVALASCTPDVDVHVVVRPQYEHRDAVTALLASFAGETRILSQLPDLSAELGWADLCLASAGLTKYEAAYLGVPAGVLSQNEGQALDAIRFQELGMTVDLGAADHIEPDQLGTRVHRLVHDAELRASLRSHSLDVFPQDPTRDLAESLARDIFRRSATV